MSKKTPQTPVEQPVRVEENLDARVSTLTFADGHEEVRRWPPGLSKDVEVLKGAVSHLLEAEARHKQILSVIAQRIGMGGPPPAPSGLIAATTPVPSNVLQLVKR